jgi:hypothetical protein
MAIDRTNAVFAWKLYSIMIIMKIFGRSASPFFPLGCRTTSPFLMQRAGKVTAVRALIDEKQGREIVIVCPRWSNWGRAELDRESEWVLVKV